MGVVQYQRPECAAQVLYDCNGVKWGVFVQLADGQPENHIRPEIGVLAPDAESRVPVHCGESYETHILALNDDCLEEIFDYFYPEDLWLISYVCQWFRSIAQKRFSAKHKSLNMFMLTFDGKYEFKADSKMYRMRKSLTIFGPFIKSSNIDVYSFCRLFEQIRTLELLVRHCTGTLNELSLSMFSLKGPFVHNWRPLFAGLKKLQLDSCLLNGDFNEMLRCASELEDWSCITHLVMKIFNSCLKWYFKNKRKKNQYGNDVLISSCPKSNHSFLAEREKKTMNCLSSIVWLSIYLTILSFD